MRITLVHPAGFNFVPGQPDFSVFANRMPPIGIAQLASWLEQFGHSVQLHDCLGPYAPPGIAANAEIVLATEPELVGFSATTSGFMDAVDMARIIREQRPQTRIVFGNVHVSSLGGWMAALCLSGLAIFWLLPTAVPPAGLDWSAYPQMALIKNIDGGGNACPSLHVASAVFAALWLGRVLWQVRAPLWLRGANWLLALAIVWSTLATRQHVLLDVIAGLLLGLLFAFGSLRQLQRTQCRPLL